MSSQRLAQQTKWGSPPAAPGAVRCALGCGVFIGHCGPTPPTSRLGPVFTRRVDGHLYRCSSRRSRLGLVPRRVRAGLYPHARSRAVALTAIPRSSGRLSVRSWSAGRGSTFRPAARARRSALPTEVSKASPSSLTLSRRQMRGLCRHLSAGSRGARHHTHPAAGARRWALPPWGIRLPASRSAFSPPDANPLSASGHWAVGRFPTHPAVDARPLDSR